MAKRKTVSTKKANTKTSNKGASTKTASTKTASTKTATVDRRRKTERRTTTSDRRQAEEPVKVERRKIERREKVNRRRQIDPTTCERDYTDEELEFMTALDNYKRANGRMFPTCSEILEVIQGLGYRRPAPDASKSAIAGGD